MLPRALPEKQQSIPMPFYSPQKFSKRNVNWTLIKFKEIIISSTFLSVRTFVKHLMGTEETPFNTNYDNEIQSQVILQSLQNHFLKLWLKKIYINKIQNIRKPITENLPLRCLCYTVTYIRCNRGICNERRLTHKRRYRRRIPRTAADPRCRNLSLPSVSLWWNLAFLSLLHVRLT